MLSNRISSNCSKIWPVNPQWLCSFQFFMSSSFAMCSQIEGRYDSSLSLTTCCWLEGFLQKMQPSSGPWVLGEISEQLKKRQSSRVPLASLLLFSLKQPYVCLLASWCQKQQWWLKTQIFHFSHSTSWKSTLKDHLCWEIFKALSCLNPEPEKEYNSYIQIDHPVPNTLNFLANLYFSSCKLFSKHSIGSQ